MINYELNITLNALLEYLGVILAFCSISTGYTVSSADRLSIHILHTRRNRALDGFLDLLHDERGSEWFEGLVQ